MMLSQERVKQLLVYLPTTGEFSLFAERAA